MDPLFEQESELEVLKSIYPDEIQEYSATHYEIRLKLDSQSERQHFVTLDVQYPPEYPEVVPILNIILESEHVSFDTEDSDSEREGPNGLNLAEAIEFSKKDQKALLEKLVEESELQVGMPSIFSLATLLKDEAEHVLADKLLGAQRDYDRQIEAREKEEQKKFHGTKVTRESWLTWRKNFREEMHIEERDEEMFNKMHNHKLTGRQIFEKGLAGNEEDIINELNNNMTSINVS